MVKPRIMQTRQRHTIAHGLYFTDGKDLGGIPTGSPQRGPQIEVQIGDFPPISRYISETMQDRDIVTM